MSMRVFILNLFIFSHCVTTAAQAQLPEFNLLYTSPGCYSELHHIRVLHEKGNYFAERLEPIEQTGNTKEDQPRVLLTEKQIEFCRAFLMAATDSNLYGCWPDEGAQPSYALSIASDTIVIEGNCSASFSYDSLEYVLFKSFFAGLETKRQKLKYSLIEVIVGTWLPKFPESKLKPEDTVILTRSGVLEGCYWTFNRDLSFKSNCNSPLNLTMSARYSIGSRQGPTIYINAGFKKEKKGEVSVNNYGVTFNFISVEEDKVYLIYRDY